jgi:dTMP kinase
LRKAFLEIAAREPERCVVINAAQPPDDVAKEIRGAVNTRLKLASAGAA